MILAADVSAPAEPEGPEIKGESTSILIPNAIFVPGKVVLVKAFPAASVGAVVITKETTDNTVDESDAETV